QCGKAAIMIEAAPGMCPQAIQRRGAIAAVRRAAGLKIVNANVGRQMHVPSRLRHQRLHMAAAALSFTIEGRLAACGCRAIKAACRRCRRRERKLIEMERREFGRDLVVSVGDVPETVPGSYGKFR